MPSIVDIICTWLLRTLHIKKRDYDEMKKFKYKNTNYVPSFSQLIVDNDKLFYIFQNYIDIHNNCLACEDNCPQFMCIFVVIHICSTIV